MDLRHFRSFVALAHERHFARAAEQLGISAPTLTEQIQTLERKLGATLLDRSVRSVVLTPAGKLFLIEAEATIRQAERARLVAQSAARGESGKIEIGYMILTSLIGLIPTIVGNFRRQNPSIDIILHRTEMIPQQRAIIAGDLDVGFVRTPWNYPAGLAGITIVELSYAAVLPVGHSLASRDEINPDELINEDFVGLSVESEISFFRNISVVTQRAEPRIVKRTFDIISLLNLVAAGYGISIVARQLARLGIPGIVFVPIKTDVKNPISMIYRKSDQTPTVTALKNYVQANIQSLSL